MSDQSTPYGAVVLLGAPLAAGYFCPKPIGRYALLGAGAALGWHFVSRQPGQTETAASSVGVMLFMAGVLAEVGHAARGGKR